VKALVEIEPVGPPFAENPALGLTLEYGLTTAPLTYDPPVDDPAELEGKPRRLPNLARVPIAYVSAQASPYVHYHDAMVDFLQQAGCDVTSLKLAEQGVEGNGHAMMLEKNNAEALEPIARWIEATVAA
jgi:hypothetical protein